MFHSHSHSHAHGHAHAQGSHDESGTTDLEANISSWDQLAASYDILEGVKEMTAKTANAMLGAYAFRKDETVVMDYACGPGLVSIVLFPHTKSILGVDLSQGMVDQYNKRVTEHGIPSEEMRAVRLDLKGEDGELDGMQFDVIVCSAAYHHFPSIDDTTRILFRFLKPTGVLLVADIVHSEFETMRDAMAGSGTAELAHDTPHHGIEEKDIRAAFEAAGLEDVSFDPDAVKMEMKGLKFKGFLAKGTKPQAG